MFQFWANFHATVSRGKWWAMGRFLNSPDRFPMAAYTPTIKTTNKLQTQTSVRQTCYRWQTQYNSARLTSGQHTRRCGQPLLRSVTKSRQPQHAKRDTLRTHTSRAAQRRVGLRPAAPVLVAQGTKHTVCSEMIWNFSFSLQTPIRRNSGKLGNKRRKRHTRGLITGKLGKKKKKKTHKRTHNSRSEANTRKKKCNNRRTQGQPPSSQ